MIMAQIRLGVGTYGLHELGIAYHELSYDDFWRVLAYCSRHY